ncbi:MAG: hypothetical protein ABIG45_04100 [Bacillota bacterium]
MKTSLTMLLLLSLLFNLTGASALVERNILLDTAFTMLEEGNPILQRYNAITGADIQARYKLGLPYFWGGKDPNRLMTLGYAQESKKVFEEGKRYIYGFDCTGFTNWINAETGRPRHDSIKFMITKKGLYKENQLPIKDVPYGQLQNYLQVGDYLAGKIIGRHIMMYIGTLADYGYAPEDSPELADYLDYPLLVHCGKNPPYGERYEKYIEENNLRCGIPNGGVAITIVGMPVEEAPHFTHQYKDDHYYYDLGGYMLTIYNVYGTTSYVWFRL